MVTLAETLSMTAPVSVLKHKARRLGVDDVRSMIALAVERGCDHYAAEQGPTMDPGRKALTDEELVILLLAGGNSYEPNAIRCAAQLSRSKQVTSAGLVRLAKMEKTERVLAHIAHAGTQYDPEGFYFWNEILAGLGAVGFLPEPALPHWSRFVSMPGRQRSGFVAPKWLIPKS